MRRALVILCLVSAPLLLVTLRSLDSVLAAMHPAYGASFRIEDLAPLLGWDMARPSIVVTQWHTFDAGNAALHAQVGSYSVSSSDSIVKAYLAFDLVFIAAYGGLFYAGLARIRSALTTLGSRASGAWAPSARSVRIGVVALAVAIAADVVEDACQAMLALHYGERMSTGSDVFYVLLFGATWLKWIAVAVVVSYTAVALGALATAGVSGGLRSMFDLPVADALHVARGLVLVAVCYAVGLLASTQTADILRGLADHRLQFACAALASFALGGVLALLGLRLYLLRGVSQAPLGRVNLRRLLAGAVIVLATAVAGVAWNHGGQGLVFPAVLVLALVAFESWGAMSGVPGRTAPAVEVPIDGPPEWVLRILFLTPPLVFSLALLQASVPDVAYDGRRAYVWLAIAAVVISAVAWPAALASSWSLGEWAPRALSWIVWALAITAVPAAWVYIDLWSASAVLGTIGVVAVFLIVAALALFGLTWVSERVTPPRLFALFGFRRIPVLALLVAWLAFASLVDKGTYHNVREAQTPTAAIDLQTAFNAWAQAHSYPLLDESAAQVQSKPDSRATPFVLVASEGGGIRAAYWTALVMNCLFDRSPASPDCNHEPSSQDVFVGSGASGGSLGLIEYAAHLLDAKPPVGTAWIGRSLGGDYVTPLVARGLFADLPNAFADFHGLFEDRAAILERSWQRSWPDNRLGRWTLQQLWTDRGSTARDATQLDRIPLLVLNGTAVDNGCRYNTSVLNVAVNSGLAGQAPSLVPDGCSSLVSFDNGGNSPTAALAGTEDLDDDLCRGSGVRLSTAALLSARFPWATPSGRVPRCGTSTAANVVDGGYFDNTGASTLLELYGRLRGLIDAYNGQRGTPCLVPLFVQIDNHYAGGSAPAGGPPPQVLVPPLTLNHVRDGHDSNGRQSAGEVFLRNVGPTGRLLPGWVHIAPRSHPGAEAPLGWTLSAGSKSDLADQLASSSNTTALADVRAWLSGGLKCSMTAP